MSAYANGHGNRVVSFLPSSGPSQGIEPVNPNFSQIATEIEAFFTTARQMEASLMQEKAQGKKLRENLNHCQAKLTQISAELENQLKESNLKEGQFKAQLQTSHQNEKNLHAKVNGLRQHLLRLQKEKSKICSDMEALTAHYQSRQITEREWYQSQHHKQMQKLIELRNQLKSYPHQEEQLRTQLEAASENEKRLQNEVRELRRESTWLKEEKSRLEADKNKADIEAEILRANLKSSQMKEEEQANQNQQMQKKLQAVQLELQRFRSAWSQISSMDQRAKQTTQRCAEMTQKMDDLNESMEKERNRRHHSEELLLKEKREKQMALTHLHTAESRLNQLTRELEELRAKQLEKFDQSGLELNLL